MVAPFAISGSARSAACSWQYRPASWGTVRGGCWQRWGSTGFIPPEQVVGGAWLAEGRKPSAAGPTARLLSSTRVRRAGCHRTSRWVLLRPHCPASGCVPPTGGSSIVDQLSRRSSIGPPPSREQIRRSDLAVVLGAHWSVGASEIHHIPGPAPMGWERVGTLTIVHHVASKESHVEPI